MCLESYINCYGIINSSKSYFENYLDKLDLKSKWIIIPKIVTGKKIKTDSIVFGKMIELIKLRNRLVHDKQKIKKITEIKDSDWLTEGDARKAIETVKELIIEFNKIDKSIDIGWISETLNNHYA